MTMLIVGLPEGFLTGALAMAGFAVAAVFCANAVDWVGAAVGAAVFAVGARARVRLASTVIFAAATWVPREALAGVVAPMARAWVDAASLLAFSRMARCFSSSLAKMGTKSSGMGLLSC